MSTNRIARYYPITIRPAKAEEDPMTDTISATPETDATLEAPTPAGTLRKIPARPRPMHRSTQTLHLPGTDSVLTIDLIVTHSGGGTDPETPVPTQWEELPESGQADWAGYSVDEWELHWRVIPGLV